MKTISDASKEVLKNCHTTLKWMWTIIMALAVKKAILNIIYYVDPATGTEVLRGWHNFYLGDVLLFIVFMTTMARLYHGDSRYLDKTYLESQLKEFDPGSYSARHRLTDFFVLICHGILFFALAAYERQFRGFFYIYVALLLFNAIWLGAVYLRAPDKDDVQYPRNWALNNIVHVCLLIGLYFLTNGLQADYTYVAFFILALSNTFFDYRATWPYYFPPIEEEKA